MKTKLTLLVVMLSALAFSQAGERIAVSDVSAADSPLALSGTLTLEAEKAVLDIKGQNLSDKGIVALVACVDAPPHISQERISHDHFFKNMAVASHSQFDVTPRDEYPYGKERYGNGPWYTPVWKGIKRVDAKIIWVQFEDGSTWGDEAAGAVIRGKRLEARNVLTHLLDTYDHSGEAAFLEALSLSSQQLQPIAERFKKHQKTQGTTAIVDEMREWLATDNARRFW